MTFFFAIDSQEHAGTLNMSPQMPGVIQYGGAEGCYKHRVTTLWRCRTLGVSVGGLYTIKIITRKSDWHTTTVSSLYNTAKGSSVTILPVHTHLTYITVNFLIGQSSGLSQVHSYHLDRGEERKMNRCKRAAPSYHDSDFAWYHALSCHSLTFLCTHTPFRAFGIFKV